MKGYIHYIKGHAESEKQAQQSLNSFVKHGWDVELVEGITPSTLDETEFDYPLIKGGRLDDMHRKGDKKYYIKKSCIGNQIRIWRKCVEENRPMAFLEHDSICMAGFYGSFDEVLVLNIDYAFLPPSVLAEHPHLRAYKVPAVLSSQQLPSDYPLRYYKPNAYNNCFMAPGTSAYAVTPKGAKRLLDAAEKNGIDQSDFFINTYNVNIEYVSPSPVKLNKINLNTSHNL
jgi:GR25 family glycosyltransferase involved in LPS biosynthesis